MKKLVIIGAGDFGREVSWIVERINRLHPTWELLGFVDDNPAIHGCKIDGYTVCGGLDWLQQYSELVYAVCSIGTGKVRKKVMDCVATMEHVSLATIIDPAAIIGRDVHIEKGCIICAGSVITIAAFLGKNVILNLNCTVGHDTVLGECCTVNPGSNISGKVNIGSCVGIGTGSQIIQGITICADCVIGAGAVVVKNIEVAGTYVGLPAKQIG